MVAEIIVCWMVICEFLQSGLAEEAAFEGMSTLLKSRRV